MSSKDQISYYYFHYTFRFWADIAFALWLNSLGVEPFVNNLFDDLRDGLILLMAMDKVRPGIVDWKRVNRPAPIKSKFKKVENTNYVVVLGKSLKFSLVGIQGSDLTDGNKTLTLGKIFHFCMPLLLFLSNCLFFFKRNPF